MVTMVMGFEPLALRHTVCELETVTGDNSQKHQKARYLAGFLRSGNRLSVTGRQSMLFAVWSLANSDWETAGCGPILAVFSNGGFASH